MTGIHQALASSAGTNNTPPVLEQVVLSGGGTTKDRVFNFVTAPPSGQLVMLFLVSEGANLYTTPAGFTSLIGVVGTLHARNIFYRVCAAGEPTSYTVVLGTSGTGGTALGVRISHFQGLPEVTEEYRAAPLISGEANPLALTPSWGNDSNLIMALMSITNNQVGSNSITTYPYASNNNLVNDAGSGSMAIASTTDIGTTFDPGPFVHGAGNKNCVTWTVGIRGTAP